MSQPDPSLSPMQIQVARFMLAAEQQVPERLLPADGVPWDLRKTLILEEAQEFAEAADAKDMALAVDALCDLLYVTFGTAVAMGINIKPFFDEVHRTNMLKFIGGHRREDGKWMKPDGWRPPRIAEMLDALRSDPTTSR